MSEMNDVQSLRDLSDLLQQLSDATGLSKSAIQSEVDKLDYPTYQFNELILVSPADFVGIIDSWAEQVKSDIRNGSKAVTTAPKTKKVGRKAAAPKATKTAAPAKKGMKGAKKAPANSTQKVSKAAPKATKKVASAQKDTGVKKDLAKSTKKVSKATPKATKKTVAAKKDSKGIKKAPAQSTKKASKAAPKASKKTVAAKKKETKGRASYKGSLPLPEGYASIVSHLYGPSLQRILPPDEVAQKKFLEAIANETKAGIALLNHLAGIIADKYTGNMSPETAYNGLKNKAVALLEDDIKPKTKRRSGRKSGRKTTAKPIAKSAVRKIPSRKSRSSKKKSAAPEEKVVLSEMELPKGYRKRVSNRYGPTLQNVLPDDSDLKKAYLNEIVLESNLGKSFLERVADSIKIKYRGKITSHTAYQGLLSKAQAM